MLSISMLLFGCATLPELPRWPKFRASHQITGKDGPLSPEKKRAIEERLKREGDTDFLQRHLAIMESITAAPLVVGNEAQLLVDGPATHKAMFQAIAGAQHNINLESYILEDVTFGRLLSDLLLRKRAAGVQVNVMYDSIGSASTPPEFFERLHQGGVNCCEFNPANPFSGKRWRLNQRDHRKILVVDGKVAFTGGINFSSVYSSGSSVRRAKKRQATDDGWRDTHLAVRGPAVAEFQRLFVQTWNKQNCASIETAGFFPTLSPAGNKIMRVIGSSPDNNVSEIYLALLSAIEHAQSQIYLTMAYFVPDEATIAALKNAAQRGVDVKLILPGFSDFWGVFHAGRSHYSNLMTAGVRIYERRDALLHAKTAVIDGVWSTIGSTNMDWRSFMHNDEVNAVVIGQEFGREMLSLFAVDLAKATRIDPAAWEERGAALRFKEWFTRRWDYLL
jgi:cardiolipin synthase A/B